MTRPNSLRSQRLLLLQQQQQRSAPFAWHAARKHSCGGRLHELLTTTVAVLEPLYTPS